MAFCARLMIRGAPWLAITLALLQSGCKLRERLRD
jgi:hypothetical protein